MLFFGLGIVASILPTRYRRSISVSPALAIVSGLSQSLLCLGFFVSGYLHFAKSHLFGGTQVALKATEIGGETALMGSGILTLAEYMLQPLTVALAYFTVEGIVRVLAASVSGDAVPSLPLAIFAWLHGRIDNARSEAALGQRVADEVELVDSSDIKLRIRSCRLKPNWDQRITIFYLDELFEIAGNEEGNAPRRFVYLLRGKPAHKLVRGTHHYDPNEALQA